MESVSSTDASDKMVMAYLQQRGYKQAESALKNEAKIKSDVTPEESSIADFILFYNESEANNPKAYEQSYSRLVKWIDDSIDAYRMELVVILYPIFVHAYLDLVAKGLKQQAINFMETCGADHRELHAQDLAILSGITEPSHFENELVQNFRNHKYGVVMSKYSFELLLCFLQDNKFMLLLRILNQYVSIQALRDKPGAMEAEELGVMGKVVSSFDSFNRQPVRLGRLPPDVPFLTDVMSVLNAQNADQEMKDMIKQEMEHPVDADAPSREDVPLEPKRLIDIQTEIELLKEARFSFKPCALPSICCYTFVNSDNGLTSTAASLRADWVASGSADSVIRLWESGDIESKGDRPCHSLVGHSSTVFGLDFSADSKFLISSSEDCTVRLWSVQEKYNLACYKGHNYPVFDVKFGPQSIYFATASHDRTARLWSTEHIFPLRIFVGHLSDVETLTFHPNSNYILTGSNDRTCRLWDIQRGHCVRIFAKHLDAVTAVAISPDGKTMASAGEDRVVKLWDLGSGKKIKSMTGHSGSIYSLDFSKDGTLLASGSSDETVRIWDVKTDDKQEVGCYPTKRTPIQKVQFTPKNLLLAMGAFTP